LALPEDPGTVLSAKVIKAVFLSSGVAGLDFFSFDFDFERERERDFELDLLLRRLERDRERLRLFLRELRDRLLRRRFLRD